MTTKTPPILQIEEVAIDHLGPANTECISNDYPKAPDREAGRKVYDLSISDRRSPPISLSPQRLLANDNGRGEMKRLATALTELALTPLARASVFDAGGDDAATGASVLEELRRRSAARRRLWQETSAHELAEG